MASTSLLMPISFPTAAAAGTTRRSFSSHRCPSGLPAVRLRPRRASPLVFVSASSFPPPSLDALIFDCDGVILESEHLHRQAYNDAFAHFGVRCPPAADTPLNWDEAFYDDLQNRIGGGKPKMRWYFGENGWPSSKIFETPPSSDSDREKLVDIIQDWKTERYKEIIKSGAVEPRPGVLRLMDEVKGAGIKLAVCSAATKSSVVLCLENLIGLERFNGLDCFLAGDDVKLKKPDPLIYITAAKAAKGAGMSCLITYTPSTANQANFVVDGTEEATADAVAASMAKEEELKSFDAEFIDVDKGVLYDVLLATNFLEVKRLLDLACQKVADMIKGKMPEEIRKTFGIKNDFMPEEEEIRNENAWAFE